MYYIGDGKMAQQLKKHTALMEDLSSVHSTLTSCHKISCNSKNYEAMTFINKFTHVYVNIIKIRSL